MDFTKIKDLASSLLSYLFYTTTYSHIFVVFSFCNIDDCSWGTKGLTEDKTTFYKEKINFVKEWLVVNTFIALAIVLTDSLWPNN